MEYNIYTISEQLSEGIKCLAEIAANKELEDENLRQKHYQDVVLSNIDVKSKEISFDKVLAWSGVTPQYLETHKPRVRNNKRNKTFWGVDVTKWLCDFWHRDYPVEYINECYRLKINSQTGEYMNE